MTTPCLASPAASRAPGGLPLFRAWGAADVGVFVDWASLHQQPRDEAQAASYLRATANVPMWYATAFRTEHLPSLRERPLVWGMTLPIWQPSPIWQVRPPADHRVPAARAAAAGAAGRARLAAARGGGAPLP